MGFHQRFSLAYFNWELTISLMIYSVGLKIPFPLMSHLMTQCVHSTEVSTKLELLLVPNLLGWT